MEGDMTRTEVRALSAAPKSETLYSSIAFLWKMFGASLWFVLFLFLT
jgi:hypothetical protein